MAKLIIFEKFAKSQKPHNNGTLGACNFFMTHWIITLFSSSLLRMKIITTAFITSLFISSAFAQTTLSGKATKLSWGGHWWTMRMGELALGWNNPAQRKAYSVAEATQFDKCISETTAACKKLMQDHLKNKGISLSPMMKFDLWVKKQVDAAYTEGSAVSMYSRATHNELKIHYIAGPEHRHYEASGFAGKCTGWSLSNMDFAEPSVDKTIDGITFNPADIKGILAAIYNGAQFFVPDDMVLGNAFRNYAPDNSPENHADPLPHDLIKAFEKHIKVGKKIIVADMDPSEGVWNHPVHGYSVKLAAPKGNKVTGTMTINYAKDEVNIDEVFTTNKTRPDLTERTISFELTVPANWDKKMATVKTSKWTGESVNEHPDSLIFGLEKDWRKAIYDYKNTDMKLEINYQLIKKVNLGGGYKIMVDELLKKYYQK